MIVYYTDVWVLQPYRYGGSAGVPMKILVVGGAGFIGSVLVRSLLSRGYYVRVLDSLLYGDSALQGLHERLELIKGDCRDAETVRKAATDMEAVIHLAAIVGVPAGNVDEELTLSTNYYGAVTCAQAARDTGSTILLNYCGVKPLYMVDESPLRAGKCMPGIHTPIYFPEHFRNQPTDDCLITAWTYEREIMGKEPGYKGTFIVPLPTVKVYE